MQRTIQRLLIIITAIAAIVAGCSTDAVSEGEVTGIVTEVTGDLVEVQSFVVLDSNGDSHKFSPGEGMTFMGAPPSHLRDHVVSGEAVRVRYHKGPSGSLIAVDVVHADAAAGDHHD